MTDNFVSLCKSFSSLLHSKIRGNENVEVTNKKMLAAWSEIEKQKQFVSKMITPACKKAQSDILADMINLYNTAQEYNINN